MKLLAIDSSTKWASVAIFKDGHCLIEKKSDLQKSHSELLNSLVHSCLEELRWSLNDLDAYAVTSGPGSFTGLRIAGNIVKTWSYIYKKPIFAVDSLSVLAFSVADQKNKDQIILPVINAYKNMVYTKFFDSLLNVLKPVHALFVKDLQPWEITKQHILVGDGYAQYKDYIFSQNKDLIFRSDNNPDYPLASALGHLILSWKKNTLSLSMMQDIQTLDWNSFQPLYVRASEAEENQQGITYRPL
ncbi:MAG: tRNA (adenosine(37)-N6)-threonylcarbamoyltransferase complex dimerization subunit type 1 TsaB [Pseudobdellovibrionaceae bacterium]